MQFIRRGSGGKIINIASMLSFGAGFASPRILPQKRRARFNPPDGQRMGRTEYQRQCHRPGYMATDNTRQLRDDADRSKDLDRIPAGRWGVPDDLQGPVVFTASQAANYINGYTLAVDGGWLAR